MGLDHWINRKISIDSQYFPSFGMEIDEIKAKNKENEKIMIPTKNIDEIKYELICWRKENHIHEWFVKNIQNGEDDCREYYVSQEQLSQFLSVLEEVKQIENQYSANTKEPDDDIIKSMKLGDKEKIKKLLPTKEGFFFGSTDYDKHYFYSISNAIEVIKEELEFVKNNPKLSISYSYHSSW